MRKVIRIMIILTTLLLSVNPVIGIEKEDCSTIIYFEAEDPEGDDYGPGSYIYPRNLAFKPYEGLFDLLNFCVSGNDDFIFFNIKIKSITNPWSAPEGFIHPVIHIYIDKAEGGKTKPLNEALGVEFSPKYAWEYCLEGIGWESSMLTFVNSQGELESIRIAAHFIPEEHLIRLTVPIEVMGKPQRKWKYYVLIGSYDGFGPGFLREVRMEPGDWFFGGGCGDGAEPRVIDLLAPSGGKYSQERQLSYPKKDGKPVIVYPINIKTGIAWGYIVFPILFLLIGFLAKKRFTIFGFWLKGKDLDQPKNSSQIKNH